MINGALPIQPRQRLALRIGNRYHGNIAESLVQRGKIGNIQSTMQRGQGWNILLPVARVVQVIDVEVNEVEVVFFVENALHQKHVMRERINTRGCEA